MKLDVLFGHKNQYSLLLSTCFICRSGSSPEQLYLRAGFKDQSHLSLCKAKSLSAGAGLTDEAVKQVPGESNHRGPWAMGPFSALTGHSSSKCRNNSQDQFFLLKCMVLTANYFLPSSLFSISKKLFGKDIFLFKRRLMILLLIIIINTITFPAYCPLPSCNKV